MCESSPSLSRQKPRTTVKHDEWRVVRGGFCPSLSPSSSPSSSPGKPSQKSQVFAHVISGSTQPQFGRSPAFPNLARQTVAGIPQRTCGHISSSSQLQAATLSSTPPSAAAAFAKSQSFRHVQAPMPARTMPRNRSAGNLLRLTPSPFPTTTTTATAAPEAKPPPVPLSEKAPPQPKTLEKTVCSFDVARVSSGQTASSTEGGPWKILLRERSLLFPEELVACSWLRELLVRHTGAASPPTLTSPSLVLSFDQLLHVELDGKRRLLFLRVTPPVGSACQPNEGPTSLQLTLCSSSDVETLRKIALPLLMNELLNRPSGLSNLCASTASSACSASAASATAAAGAGKVQTQFMGPSLIWTHS